MIFASFLVRLASCYEIFWCQGRFGNRNIDGSSTLPEFWKVSLIQSRVFQCLLDYKRNNPLSHSNLYLKNILRY